MQFAISGAFNATEEIAAAADYPFIRLFMVALNASSVPLDTLQGVELPWSVASPATVTDRLSDPSRSTSADERFNDIALSSVPLAAVTDSVGVEAVVSWLCGGAAVVTVKVL